MENQQEKQIQATEEKIEPDNKNSTDIEQIEKIQPSHKSNFMYDKKKFHPNKGYFNPSNHNHHQGHNYSNYQNQNTMNKNRTNSEKYNTRGRYIKSTYIDPRSKNNRYIPKKRNQEPFHNNDFNHQKNSDEKLDFVNPYEEAENFEHYREFEKLPNLNFLKQNIKQNVKQKRFPEEEEKESKNFLGQNNSYLKLQNQNLLNQLKLTQNNLGNKNLNPFNALGGFNQIPNNFNLMTNNIQNVNKAAKNNIMNFPLFLNQGLQNLNNAKISGINNMNNLNNINNNATLLLSQFLNNNQFKKLISQQSPNNKISIPIPNQQLDNNTINNQSPQKINHINNKNSLNENNNIMNNINLNISDKFNATMNTLVQAYIKSLQYQQLILNKMTQLFNTSSNMNSNPNIYTEIQMSLNQLKNSLNNEISQLSSIPGLSNNTSIKSNSGDLNENKENKNTMNENDNNDDKYIQNILSTWPEQKFYKPYSPLLKLEKSSSLLKQTNLLNTNSLFTNPSLNINTMTYSNLSNSNLNTNILLIDPEYKNKEEYDDQKIKKLLEEGKCLTGIFRSMKSHGYITVKGLDNDVLIKSKNFFGSLNLDEVVIELTDFKNWKNLTKNKGRKHSYVNDDSIINNIPNYYMNEDAFKTKEDRLYFINKKLKDLRPEGRIVKIIRSPNKEKLQICTIKIEANQILAIPIDDTIPKILINIKNKTQKLIPNIDTMPNRYLLSYSPLELEKDYKNYKKKYFFVKIHSFASSNIFNGPLGYIVNEIGSSGNIDVESEVLLNLNNVNYRDNFSDDIMKEVDKKLKEMKITDEYIISTKRKDFRNELVFTIDPYTSKDLDDAIHVKVIDEKTKLLEIGVHIADPTAYIDVDSLLDKEALNRATSVYLVQKKIPMLPLILSDDVCSIMPGKDTLSVSCIFRIHLENGSLDENFEPYFTLSVVNSRAKWDYDLVQKMIEKKEVKYDELKFEDGTKPQSEEIFNELKKSVEVLYQLTKLVKKERYDSGSLMIENESIEFDLDKNTLMPTNFHISYKNEAHSLIEELMLISNLLCAKFIYSHLKKFALIRRHPFFNDKNYSEMTRYFSANKIYNREFNDMIEINKILKNIKKENNNEYMCVQQKLKFLLLRAEYVFAGKFSQDELRHYSLNYDLYTHFTSPIRRYPDMIVHRQLKEIFKFKNNNEKPSYKKFEKYYTYIDHINKRYNSARIISLKSKRLYQCLYLKNAPKKKYHALIMDIISTNNNKKGNNNTQGNNFLNWNNNNNGNNEEEETTLMIYVPEINMEVEWRKTDEEKDIVFSQYNKEKNYFYIDYKSKDQGIKNRYLKCFDSLQVELFSVDSIPIDAKCKIDFDS